LGRNVDPKCQLFSCWFSFFFHSFLFIDPLPLFTGMAFILFGKVISGVCKRKKEKWSTGDGRLTTVALEQQRV